MHQMRSSAVGTGRPSSLSACWMDLVIPSLGSDKVPSRSKQITFMESSPPQSSHGVMSAVFAISRRVRSTSDSGKVAAAQRTDVEDKKRASPPANISARETAFRTSPARFVRRDPHRNARRSSRLHQAARCSETTSQRTCSCPKHLRRQARRSSLPPC